MHLSSHRWDNGTKVMGQTGVACSRSLCRNVYFCCFSCGFFYICNSVNIVVFVKDYVVISNVERERGMKGGDGEMHLRNMCLFKCVPCLSNTGVFFC